MSEIIEFHRSVLSLLSTQELKSFLWKLLSMATDDVIDIRIADLREPFKFSFIVLFAYLCVFSSVFDYKFASSISIKRLINVRQSLRLFGILLVEVVATSALLFTFPL